MPMLYVLEQFSDSRLQYRHCSFKFLILELYFWIFQAESCQSSNLKSWTAYTATQGGFSNHYLLLTVDATTGNGNWYIAVLSLTV